MCNVLTYIGVECVFKVATYEWRISIVLVKTFETNYSPDVQHVPEELMITKYFDLHGFCGDLMNLITATKSDVQHVPDELMTMKYF